MIFDLEHVKNKQPFFLKYDVISDWTTEMAFLDTHPEEHMTYKEDKMRIYLSSSTSRASLSPWAKGIAREMRHVFHKNPISLIKFYSFGKFGQSYPWHKDKMDVFLVQAQGDCSIRVENTEWETKQRLFQPGDCVFIPRGTHHELIPNNSRITYSFGVEAEPDPSSYIAI